ncbi:glycosyltransferase [Caballeronia sp. LZ032]|uniref:glycosyltransferase n=1 Tax=Caballeronia sp. LZ032 TaxID=3038565 RepID=UPI00285E6DC6|nr:glycosyltransferase [Caballeronia sp. LZ032]MDR5883631.1 glycosyltransferase [Caballeronia sp. LZ032]
MLALLSWLFQAMFLAVVVYFALYVLLELRVFLISRKVEQRRLTELDHMPHEPEPDFWPRVSVLLPICNESGVVERLIDAACRLDYPSDAFEILVLDDSSDRTTELARAKVDGHAAQGIDIRLIKRCNRKGHKAGNLVNGIQQSRGEFFAIFDADFVPPVDFLLRTIPRFTDPELGFLQTGIGYENRDVSFLTRFQAMEMGHQQYVTVGLSEDGDMASLSGSSCVWRKACVDALGGWNDSSVTEDVDLGYRAQFGDWKYAYLRDVVSMSVLPETISAFRVQRERWGRGLIHSAFKHVRKMLLQPLPLVKRLHAISVMFSSVLLAAIHVLVLLSLPLTYLVHFDGAGVRWGALMFFILVAVWGVGNALGARKGGRFEDRPSILMSVAHTYLYIAMFLPMSWYYFVGGVRALFGVYNDFNRTPKGKDELHSAVPRINTILWLGEVLTFLYSLFTIGVAFESGNIVLVPLNVTVCVGFGMVLRWTWTERCARVRA